MANEGPHGRIFRPVLVKPPVQRRLMSPTGMIHRPIRPARYRLWTEDALSKALGEIENGLTSIRQAAASWGVPRSTLHDYVVGKSLLTDDPRKYFSKREEDAFAKFIIESADVGFGRTSKEIMCLASNVLSCKGLDGATVGRGWFYSFLSRHPEIAYRKAESLSRARHACTDPVIIANYFDYLETVLVDNDLLGKSTQIFNFDEIGVPFSYAPQRVLAAKTKKHVFAPTTGDKSQITVLACGSAAGIALPPYVICKKKISTDFEKGHVPGTGYDATVSGWSNAQAFQKWFQSHFLPFAPAVRPLLLLMDGHSSHFNPAVIDLAAESGIIVLCLPPNTTHILQPLDRCAFSSLKRKWAEECHAFSVKNGGKLVTKANFSEVFRRAWTASMTIENVSASFKATGIFPFNKNRFQFPEAEELLGREAEELPEARRNIAFLPFISPSPAKRTTRPTVNQSAFEEPLPAVDSSSQRNAISLLSDVSFTDEEVKVYQRRFENGYDLADEKYAQWLRMQKGKEAVVMTKAKSPLALSLPPIKQRPRRDPSTAAARVLTSDEARASLKERLSKSKPKAAVKPQGKKAKAKHDDKGKNTGRDHGEARAQVTEPLSKEAMRVQPERKSKKNGSKDFVYY